MPDSSDILTAFREELITAGLVRRPGVAGPLHPAHIERRGGTPAPGEGEGDEVDPLLVIGIRGSTELAEATGYEAAQRRRLIIDVLYRPSAAKANAQAAVHELMALDAGIRARLFRPETNYGYGFELGGGTPIAGGGVTAPIWTHQAALWGGLGKIGAGPGGTDDHLAKYMIECAP